METWIKMFFLKSCRIHVYSSDAVSVCISYQPQLPCLWPLFIRMHYY